MAAATDRCSAAATFPSNFSVAEHSTIPSTAAHVWAYHAPGTKQASAACDVTRRRTYVNDNNSYQMTEWQTPGRRSRHLIYELWKYVLCTHSPIHDNA